MKNRKTQLNLLIAPAGFGKTRFCLEQFRKQLSASRDLTAFRSYFVVPTKEHADRILDLLLRFPEITAVGKAHVTTFEGLVRHLAGEAEHIVVTDVLKNLFVRQILKSTKLEYFHGLCDLPGFVELVSDFIGEAKESGLGVDAIIQSLRTLEKGRGGLKYKELGAILLAYEKRLSAEKLYDLHDTAKLLEIYLAEHQELGGYFQDIMIDGFFEFLPYQIQVLKFFAKTASSIMVTLTMDPDLTKNRFSPVFDTFRELERLGFTVTPAGLSKNLRARGESLCHLEQRIFRVVIDEDKTSKDVRPDAIEIFEATGKRGEMEMVARTIRKLYATNRYHFSDFCIILRTIGSYVRIIEDVFGDYDIPVVIHERERLRHDVFAVSLMSLLKIFADGWKKEDVFRFLYSGISETPSRLVSYMEHYVYEEGVMEGREAWLGAWDKFRADNTVRDEERLRTLQKITAIEDRFNESRSALGHIQIVRSLIHKYIWSNGLREETPQNMSLSRALAIRQLLKVLDELAYGFLKRDEKEVSFAEFYAVFSRTVEVALFSKPSWGKNRVQVYDISTARQKEYKVVFMSGLLENEFPLRIREDPLLKDLERKKLTVKDGPIFKERLPRQAIERYLFYLGITRAHEQLYLTYPRFQLDGTEAAPSFYIEDVKRCFSSEIVTRIQRPADILPPLEEVRTHDELDRVAVLKLFEQKSASVFKASAKEQALALAVFKHRFKSHEFQSAVREIYANRLRFGWSKRREQKLSDPKALNYFAKTGRIFNPTKLENYAACPFRYFLANEVKLKEPEEELSPRKMGIVLHKAVERFFKDGGYQKSLSEAKDFMAGIVEEVLKTDPLKGDKQYRIDVGVMELRELLDRCVDFEFAQKANAVFVPKEFEYFFGKESPWLELSFEHAPENVIKVRGKIDRVDVDPTGRRAVLVDYKYGKGFKRKDIENGLLLQLPIYLLALECILKKTPVGAYFFIFNEVKGNKVTEVKRGFFSREALEQMGLAAAELRTLGIGPRKQNVLPDAAFRELVNQGAEWAKTYVKGIQGGSFPVYPKDCVSYCKFKAVCRIEPWMIDRIQFELAQEKSGEGKP